ncbi:uncharacterized protein LOC111087175 [Limulus polyphemus]|uniref:Uncharacterized protein LOC111087175 n=1 Tax=Limulus polyphemus TaxID=6850 RepID=A0ABM1SYB4_LIMPO|nr:uncharacterized protein LOC111087175 [Limulus polyphemus]
MVVCFGCRWMHIFIYLVIGGLVVTQSRETQSDNGQGILFDSSSDSLYSTIYTLEPFHRILRHLRPGYGVDMSSFLYRFPGNGVKRENLKKLSNRDFVMGSEFLGKRSISNEANNVMDSEVVDKKMGSEFVDKKMGSEFLGKRMGSEFLGKRLDDIEDKIRNYLFPKRQNKRIGSEFLGKRLDIFENDTTGLGLTSDHQSQRGGQELLGKRMGSNFLGKRMGSEFLGRRKREIHQKMSSPKSTPEDSVPI